MGTIAPLGFSVINQYGQMSAPWVNFFNTLGNYQTYSPVFTGIAVGDTAPTFNQMSGRYVQIGKITIVNISLAGLASNGSGSSQVRISLPTTASNNLPLDAESGYFPCGLYNNPINCYFLYGKVGAGDTSISLVYPQVQYNGVNGNLPVVLDTFTCSTITNGSGSSSPVQLNFIYESQ